jgi:hypothetical protein
MLYGLDRLSILRSRSLIWHSKLSQFSKQELDDLRYLPIALSIQIGCKCDRDRSRSRFCRVKFGIRLSMLVLKTAV